MLACTLTSSLGHHNWTSESSVYFLFNICLSNQNVLLQYQFICFNFLLKYQEIIQICGTQFLWVTLSMKFIHLNYQIWCLFIINIKSKSKKITYLQSHKKITIHMKNQIFWLPKIWMIKHAVSLLENFLKITISLHSFDNCGLII